MDALKLLILASEDHRKSSKPNDFSSPMRFEDEVVDGICLGDRRDSIMLLAEQASKITPIKNFHRPRASSEPWMTNSSIQTLFPHSKMQYQPNMPNLNMGIPLFLDAPVPKGVVPLSSSMPSSSSSNVRSSDGAMSTSNTVTFTSVDVTIQPPRYDSSSTENVSGEGLFLYQMKENLEPSASSLPEGRIGIYNKEERKALIRKFHEKQKRRIWNKKVRYFCRKNLADTRVRIKGRFVNPEKYNKIIAEQALASGKSPAFMYANIGKTVEEISPTSSTEEGVTLDRAHSNNANASGANNQAIDSSGDNDGNTSMPTFSNNRSVVYSLGNDSSNAAGGSSGVFNNWPDGLSYVAMGSNGPMSGLTQRLFQGSLDSSSSGPGGFYLPYGLNPGAMMSASTDSATSNSSAPTAAALAAALAAGASSSGYPGSFYNFMSSSSEAMQGLSGSTDSSGSSSSSLGLLNMFALMTSQSMDSLDVNGADPFANLQLSLSSQSQDIINGSSGSNDSSSDANHHHPHSSSSSNSNSYIVPPAEVNSGIISGTVADTTAFSSSSIEVSNPTDRPDGDATTVGKSNRKRKSTSPPPEAAEGEGEGESPSSSSTSSPNDDVPSTRGKSVSESRSRSKSQHQQGTTKCDGKEEKSRRNVSQSNEQVDHQKQTSLRKRK